MADISEKEWKLTLIKILELLSEPHYIKMLVLLSEIKQCSRDKPKEEMAEIIIQTYGEEKSITEIREVMVELPRNDETVKKLLKPFVDKVEKGQLKRKKPESDSESSEEETDRGVPRSPQSVQPTVVQTWRKTIEDLKSSRNLENKTVTVKVLQKSGLRTYITQEDERKYFFNLGVADETGSCKVMVYRKDRYKFFEVNKCYGFRHVTMDDNEVLKVFQTSKVSKTGPINVPEELRLEAEMIIYPQAPLCSITEAMEEDDGAMVSVEGTIREVGQIERVRVKNKRRRQEKLQLRLSDGDDSMRLTMWGDAVQQLRGTTDGDFVRVTNVRTKHYFDEVSLNSTWATRIVKVQSAAVQDVSMVIIGIVSAGRDHTELEAEINGQIYTYEVETARLAKAFGVPLDFRDFEEKLLEKLPLNAEGEIKGKTINKIRAAKEI